MRTLTRLAATLLLLICSALLWTPLPARAKAIPKEELSRLRKDLKSKEEHVRIRAVNELARLADPAAARELRKVVMNDRSDRVRALAAKSIGERKDPQDLRFLLAALRPLKKRPVALAGVVDGIGTYRDPKCVKKLFDIGRLWMLRHRFPTLAAIRALGRIRTKEAVESLVKLLQLTEPRQGYGPGGASGAEPLDGSYPGIPGYTSDGTQARLSDYQPYITSALQQLTGEIREDVDDWTEWWKENGKRCDPTKIHPDPNLTLHLVDVEYGYRITRPDGSFRWVDPPEKGFLRTAVLEQDGEIVARLSVLATSVIRQKPATAEDLAREQKEGLRKRFTMIVKESWDERVKVDSVPGIHQSVIGVSGDRAQEISQTIVLHRSVLFLIRVTLESDPGPYVRERIGKFLDSFHFLK